MTNFREVEKNIWLLAEPDADDRHEGYLPGWYFSDEVDWLHGPFAAIEETRELLANYCRDLG